MAITLASDHVGDAALTDGIGRSEIAAAARLWVRYWPDALATARLYVEPDEVPGLAAEALIGTIAAIAIGRGPREDVAGFLGAAVAELGEDDGPEPSGEPVHPDLFTSPMLTSAFTDLDVETQRTLRTFTQDGELDGAAAAALTVLQHCYLAEHADRAVAPGCRRMHIGLMSVADGTAVTVSAMNWLHVSECAWCTEAFHEMAYSSVALGTLIDAGVLARVPAPPTVPFVPLMNVEPVPTEPEPVVEAEPELELAPPPEPLLAPRPLRPLGIGRAAAGTVLFLGAASVIVAVIVGNGDHGTIPTAAGTAPGTTPAAPLVGGPSAPGTSLPASSFSVAGPRVAVKKRPAPSATASAADPTPSATPTKKPSTKPTPAKPSPSSTPTTQAPAPTPTATPTRSCNGLQHLLGYC